jgi:RimJ/RimL family protein N-acetyltransferase
MSTRSSKRKPAKRRRPTRPTPKPRQVKPPVGLPPFAPEQVRLVPTRGGKGRGGDVGGEAWRIEADGKRAGVVFINLVEEEPIGRHASIQIYLNAASRGRKIGRIAYRKACEASKYGTVYAHMQKANVASRRAAEEAGFIDVSPPGLVQLILMRRRDAP